MSPFYKQSHDLRDHNFLYGLKDDKAQPPSLEEEKVPAVLDISTAIPVRAVMPEFPTGGCFSCDWAWIHEACTFKIYK